MKKYISTILIFILTGCATGYKDSRPPEVQNKSLQKTMEKIIGKYSITRITNNSSKKFTDAEIKFENDLSNFNLKSSTEIFSLFGAKCHDVPKENSELYVFCETTRPDITYFFILKVTEEKVFESGALIGGFSPINLKKGDVLINFHNKEMSRGRDFYYALRPIE